MPMLPQESKLCRMMLTSRMILTEEQQRFVCEGDLKNYMEYLPDWLQEVKDDKTHNSKNWMDLDKKMTETIALCRAIGKTFFIMPDDPEQFQKCETIEKMLVMLMNTMCLFINKICYAPNDGLFDLQYARSRFTPKLEQKLCELEDIITGPFIMGDTLPVYADYLLYACLYDANIFIPGAYEKSPKISNFMDKFKSYKSPIRRWFKSNDSKSGEYIRPPVPTINTLLMP